MSQASRGEASATPDLSYCENSCVSVAPYCPLSPRNNGISRSPKHKRGQSLSKSPINLPVRTNSNLTNNIDVKTSNLMGSTDPSLPVLQPALPARLLPALSPRSPPRSPRSLSPRRSFYMEKSVPAYGDNPLGIVDSGSCALNDPGLIFDDHDDRLPPPDDTPSCLVSSDIDSEATPDFLPEIEEVTEDFARGISHESINKQATNEASGLVAQVPSFLRPTRTQSGNSSMTPQLMRPPKLSNRKSNSRHGTASYSIEEQDQNFSDVDSDKATIMSDDRDEERTMDDCFQRNTNSPDNQENESPKKSWFRRIFGSKPTVSGKTKDEVGEFYDSEETENIKSQMTVFDDNLGFSRLNPETVQRHAQMFNAGGIHNSIAPNDGGPTSLIEELEIRKAGKRVQRQIFLREIAEIERQRSEDAARQGWAHPADSYQNLQPTLLQMQHMAELDYKNRVDWHTRAINRNYIQEHADETLAQRRSRLKYEKASESIETNRFNETLAERRERLRRERESEISILSVATN